MVSKPSYPWLAFFERAGEMLWEENLAQVFFGRVIYVGLSLPGHVLFLLKIKTWECCLLPAVLPG